MVLCIKTNSQQKMPRLVVTSDGITIQDEQSALGEQVPVETRFSWTTLEEYTVSIQSESEVSLDEFIETPSLRETDNGDRFASFLISDVRLDNDTKQIRLAIIGDASRIDPPPVPKLDIAVEDIRTNSRQKYYRSLLYDRETSAKLIRRLIYDAGTIQKGELRKRLEAAGYSSIETPLSGTLNVLEHLTEEIERHGRGDEEKLRWRER